MIARRTPGFRSFWLAALGLVGLTPALADAFPTEPGDLTNPLEEASDCQSCHFFDNPSDLASEPPVNPYQWAGTMMGNSARDPVFWAGVAVASQDMPGATEECVRCHSPRAFLGGRGGAIAADELLPQDRDGVTCDVCHRAYDDGSALGNAHYAIDDAAVNGEVPKRGPWSYAIDHEHEWSTDNAFMASSAVCGVCHDVSTPSPRVDALGAVIAPVFNEQRTYSEWLNSDYSGTGPGAQGCVDCHMPAYADGVGCEQFLGEARHPTGARRHDLVGANRFMLEMMRDLYGVFGTDEVFDSLYSDAIDRLDDFLPGAATLDVQFPTEVDLCAGIPAVPVTVTNETGHKLPTGYSEGRVMWLEFTATYAGEQIWASGRWDEASQTIEDDAQVRRYEGVAEDSIDGTQLHLLRNDRWIEDNRIPPLGLTMDPETDPVGDRYTPMNGVWPNFDAFDYAFPQLDLARTMGEADEIELGVRLLYVVNTKEYIEHLEDVNVTNSAGADIAAEFEARGWAPPMVLQETSVTVPLSGFNDDGACPSGDGDGTSDAGGETETGASTSNGDSGGFTEDTSSDATGMQDDGPIGGGACNCSSHPSPGDGWGWTGMFVLVGLSRRRRARTGA